MPSSKQSMQQACLPVSWNNKPLPFFAVALIFLRSFQLSAQRARARSMRTPLHKRRTGESQTATRGPSSLCHGARGSPPSACAREARLQPLAPPPQFPQTLVGLSELAPRRCSQLQLPRSLATRPKAQDMVHPNSHQARRRQASRCRRHHARSRRKSGLPDGENMVRARPAWRGTTPRCMHTVPRWVGSAVVGRCGPFDPSDRPVRSDPAIGVR